MIAELKTRRSEHPVALLSSTFPYNDEGERYPEPLPRLLSVPYISLNIDLTLSNKLGTLFKDGYAQNVTIPADLSSEISILQPASLFPQSACARWAIVDHLGYPTDHIMWSDVGAGKRPVQNLLSQGFTIELTPKPGDLVLYFMKGYPKIMNVVELKNMQIQHFGIVDSDPAWVQSKFMAGPVCRHRPHAIPSSWGDSMLIARPPLLFGGQSLYER